MGNAPATPDRPKCMLCHKKLRTFPTKFDWSSRRYHKSCYRIHLENISVQRIIDEERAHQRVMKIIQPPSHEEVAYIMDYIKK